MPQPKTVKFTGETLIAGLAKAHGQRRLEEKLLVLSKPKLLIDDELSTVFADPVAATARH
ncbi:hypothetical protein [Bradyrhizobium sp. UFLA05-112]